MAPARPQDLFQRLPTELQDQIFSLLDYRGAIMMSQVNRLCHARIRPKNRPRREKIAYVLKIQELSWWNDCYIVQDPGGSRVFVDSWGERCPVQGIARRKLVWDENGFACFGCFEVRPFSGFTVEELRWNYTKMPSMERRHRYRRRCIDCSIVKGLYKDFEVVYKVDGMWAWLKDANKQPKLEKKPMVYCAICKALSPSHHATAVLTCRMCGRRREIEPQVLVCCCNEMSHQCSQSAECSDCHDTKGMKTCRFCKHLVCKNCAVKITDGGVWCGRSCTSAAYFMWKTANSEGKAKHLKLTEAIMSKRTRRRCDEAIDVLNQEEEEDCLNSLFSHETVTP